MELFGGDPPHAGKVPADWLEQQAVARGRIEISRGRLQDVDEPGLRYGFEREYPKLLDAHGMEHLDISEVRSRQRAVTQAFSRWLFDRGAAGIVYRSNLDDLPCLALFEGRASLVAKGESEPLIQAPVELLEVCNEFGLSLGAMW